MKQSNLQTGRTVHQIPCRAAMNSVEWNPKYNLLAYAGDDKNKYQADEGMIFFGHLVIGNTRIIRKLQLTSVHFGCRCFPNFWF